MPFVRYSDGLERAEATKREVLAALRRNLSVGRTTPMCVFILLGPEETGYHIGTVGIFDANQTCRLWESTNWGQIGVETVPAELFEEVKTAMLRIPSPFCSHDGLSICWLDIDNCDGIRGGEAVEHRRLLRRVCSFILTARMALRFDQ